MTTGTTRLRRLLDDLLTASRLQASALEMRPEVVSVGDVVREAVTTVRRTHPDAEIVSRRAARHHGPTPTGTASPKPSTTC